MRMRGYHVRSKVTSCTSKMVFFTCNACGSSLKKNQVEKHYQSECPRCEVLSCMDCGRDFHGDEYAGHTKCISEAEKYQGGLFRESGKAGGGGKGEKKQQEWLERIQGLMANGTKVNPRISRLLERIAQYPNIPRKRAKFENFVKNSVNIRDQATLGELWDIFSTAIKQTTTVVETESSSRVIATEGNEQNEADRSVVAENGEPSHKEKKKKKKESVGVETCDAPDTDSEQNQTKTTKKKKKKRVDESVETCDIDYEQVRTKKKKKRKHKEEVETIQACNAEVEEDNSTPTAVEEMEVSVEKKKKLKRAAASSATVAEVDDSLPNGDLKKKKKTKSKEQIDASGVERGDDLVGVGPMEVAVEYISGHHNNSIADDAETKPKKAKKKRKSERETFIGEEMLKHKHK